MLQTTTGSIVRKADDRGQTKTDWLESRHTFSFGDYLDPNYTNFGPLRVINDDTVSPAGGFATHGHKDMEIITIVLEGQLAHKDSLGNGSIIKPGEVQTMSAGTGILHSEFNPSPSDEVHFLQVWIQPNKKAVEPSYEQKTFSLDAAKNTWQLLASPDGADSSIAIVQDAKLFQTYLPAGEPLTYEIAQDRQVWIHVIEGPLEANGQALNNGDGFGLPDTGAVNLKANEASHLLLFDLVI